MSGVPLNFLPVESDVSGRNLSGRSAPDRSVSVPSGAGRGEADWGAPERNGACLDVSSGAGTLLFLIIPWPAAEESDRSERKMKVQASNRRPFTGQGLRRRQSPRRSRASIGGRALRA